MLTELFIENVQLDLSDDMQMLFTYQIDDIKTFGTKNTSFSKTITLPGTAKNNKAFGFIFETTQGNSYSPSLDNVNYNFNPAKSARCNVFVDHVQILKGVIRVLSINVTNNCPEYECSVFGELGGFMSQIANKMLTDLDFNAYNQAWTWTNIQNSWNSIAGSGVLYPLGDYGNVISGHDVDIRGYRPALYVKEYLTKILAQTDYTWDFPLLSTSLFDKLIVPHNEDELYILTKMPLSRYDTTLQALFVFSGGWIVSPHYAVINTAISMNSFTAQSGDTEFRYTGTNTIKGDFFIGFYGYHDSNYTSSGHDWSLNLYINGTKVGTFFTVDFPINTGYPGGAPYIQIDIDKSYVKDISIANGDVIAIKAEPNSLSGSFAVEVKTLYFNFETPNNNALKATYNDTIAINNCIPKNIKQTDFFTSILKMFNLYVYENVNEDKMLYIAPYPSFYTDDVVDWDGKLDRSQTITLKPMSELTARFFNFLYDTDSDYWNDYYKKKYGKGYGDYLLDTEYDFSKEKADNKIIFSSSPLVRDSDSKYFVPYYKLSGTTQDRMNTKIRILIAEKIGGFAPANKYKVTDGGTTIANNVDAYCYAGHLDVPQDPTFDLNWNFPEEIFYAMNTPYTMNNLFNTYWLDYMFQITHKDSQLMTCYVNLTNDEIENIDWSVKYHIDGAYWRLNKIIDFNPIQRNLTKVELLKVV